MKKAVLYLYILCLSVSGFATHQRAGEITYQWINGLTYEATIVTYTYSLSPADRPYLEIFWGDGTSDTIQRLQQVYLGNDINKNVYKYLGPGTGGRHTYAAPGTYILSMEDPNRNAGIVNIPNSVNIPFFIETTLVISPFFQGNSSPVLTNPPIDNACLYQPFYHNPWAVDPDGDSLSYRLDACKGAGGVYIPGFFYPQANIFSIDAHTGELIWDSPQLIGEFNICIIVDEWRSGIKIGSVRRDMQINVVNCDNNPPVIKPIMDTCVLAGTNLSFLVYAYDPDSSQLTLTGNGAPLMVSQSPATFPSPTTQHAHVSAWFHWSTTCAHVKKSPYQMNFKVIDSDFPVALVDYESVNITIVAPAPQNPAADIAGKNIQLHWNKSICDNAIGYKIYRRSGFYGFIPDHCETGVPAYTGYSLIGTTYNVNDTAFLDNNNGAGLIRGIDYCYMIIAYFADGAESYASEEVCNQLPKDAPVMTNVSIRNTDNINGSVFVAWSKPDEFDTLAIPGPYKYYLYRAPQLHGGIYQKIDSLLSINDTTYIDTLINTVVMPYHYRVDFYNNTPGNIFFVDSAYRASSLFLETHPSDNTITLTWQCDVPWINDYYTIYRWNSTGNQWDSIGFSLVKTFADTNLTNGISYCYKVKSTGHYSAGGFAYPLINFSQSRCDSPIDNEAPCPPVLTGSANCQNITNLLTWTNPNNHCADDVVKITLYYTPDNNSDYTAIYTTYNENDTSYLHQNLNTIVGCYYVVATDSNNNDSPNSNVVCFDIDLCSTYHLPNVFTPNGDGINDFFIPFPYDFVEKIDIKIYSRWGNQVFASEDPDINWDGKNQSSNNDCADGVYYYICEVYEYGLNGLKQRTLSGHIELIR
jgi:gliding motility-associated-like protein